LIPAHDAELDCRACGACCREAADGVVLVSAADIVRWKRAGANKIVDGLVEGHFSELAFPALPSGACVHLGAPSGANDCSIYETRGESCHALVPGSSQCLSYRRRAHVDPKP
jgi:Fe-S-cluster containining protein